jgi:hypothetical protein
MRRITISLSDDLALLVTREADRREISASELVRVALSHLLRPAGGREIPWVGLVREPEMVYGANLDEALAEEWSGGDASTTSDRTAKPPKGQRSKKGTSHAIAGDRR